MAKSNIREPELGFVIFKSKNFGTLTLENVYPKTNPKTQENM